MKEDLKAGSTERIAREIDSLQTRLRSQKSAKAQAANDEGMNDGGGVSG
jgi:hypothetical protein